MKVGLYINTQFPEGFNLAERVFTQLFERAHGCRESLNRYIVKSGNRISIHELRFTNHAAFFFDFALSSSALFA